MIQRAGDRALRAGTTMRRVLEIAREIRTASQIPLLLFTYLNPVLRYGLESLARDAKEAGIDGVLLTDASVEEAEEFTRVMQAAESRHRISRGPHEFAAAIETNCRVFHRVRLSGLAPGCHRGAAIRIRIGRTAHSGHAGAYQSSTRRWIWRFAPGTRRGIGAASGRCRSRERTNEPD